MSCRTSNGKEMSTLERIEWAYEMAGPLVTGVASPKRICFSDRLLCCGDSWNDAFLSLCCSGRRGTD